VHEFSIAISIIEIAEKEAKAANANSITELVLDIGTQSGIEIYALETALEMAVINTSLEKAKIQINQIQAEAKCKDCSEVFIIENIFGPCPKCGGFYHEIISGKEMKIKSLLVETD
jgi:hydrogenase nickel incorporation protein HypA/HybF